MIGIVHKHVVTHQHRRLPEVRLSWLSILATIAFDTVRQMQLGLWLLRVFLFSCAVVGGWSAPSTGSSEELLVHRANVAPGRPLLELTDKPAPKVNVLEGGFRHLPVAEEDLP